MALKKQRAFHTVKELIKLFPRRRRPHAVSCARLSLRGSILARLLSSPATYPGLPSPHRLLSAAAPAVYPNPSFAVEEYLVATCGLTRAQALKASTKISRLKSPTNPNAVRAFLAGLGLSGADVAAAVAKDLQLLCAKVDKTLAPVVTDLTQVGLSHTEIACLVPLAPGIFRRRSAVSNLPYYLSLVGSQNLVRFFKQSSSLLRCSLEKVVKPNVAILRYSGLGDSDVTKLCLSTPWVLSANPERVQPMLVCAQGLGVPPGSGIYRHVLECIAFIGEEHVAAKVEYMKKTFRWSDVEVRIAVCKAPMLLTRSMDMLQSKSEFLISEAGLEPVYIAHRSIMVSYSLDGRLRPRYYVLKFLMENGLLDRARDYYNVVALTEKAFMDKLICPHKEAAPYLAEDYAAACKGEMPTRFRFT